MGMELEVETNSQMGTEPATEPGSSCNEGRKPGVGAALEPSRVQKRHQTREHNRTAGEEPVSKRTRTRTSIECRVQKTDGASANRTDRIVGIKSLFSACPIEEGVAQEFSQNFNGLSEQDVEGALNEEGFWRFCEEGDLQAEGLGGQVATQRGLEGALLGDHSDRVALVHSPNREALVRTKETLPTPGPEHSGLEGSSGEEQKLADDEVLNVEVGARKEGLGSGGTRVGGRGPNENGRTGMEATEQKGVGAEPEQRGARTEVEQSGTRTEEETSGAGTEAAEQSEVDAKAKPGEGRGKAEQSGAGTEAETEQSGSWVEAEQGGAGTEAAERNGVGTGAEGSGNRAGKEGTGIWAEAEQRRSQAEAERIGERSGDMTGGIPAGTAVPKLEEQAGRMEEQVGTQNGQKVEGPVRSRVRGKHGKLLASEKVSVLRKLLTLLVHFRAREFTVMALNQRDCLQLHSDAASVDRSAEALGTEFRRFDPGATVEIFEILRKKLMEQPMRHHGKALKWLKAAFVQAPGGETEPASEKKEQQAEKDCR